MSQVSEPLYSLALSCHGHGNFQDDFLKTLKKGIDIVTIYPEKLTGLSNQSWSDLKDRTAPPPSGPVLEGPWPAPEDPD